MKVLVTGGNGFIGGYVSEQLASMGHVPITFDRFGAAKADRSGYAHFSGDVRDTSAVKDAVFHSDAVIHLAGLLGTQETIADPQGTVDTNLTGSLNVFRACQLHLKKCVFLTLGNYFMNNPYSISKSAAERFALMFNKEHGTQIAVVRGFNVYGPRQKVGPVKKIMPSMIMAALKHQPITVYGDGAQVQDMIFVTDIASILCQALLVDHGVYDKIFEAGSGKRTTVLAIAEQILDIVGGGQIKKKPMRPGETPGAVILADPETLSPLYPDGSRKVTSLTVGITRTVEYYRSELAESEMEEAAHA